MYKIYIKIASATLLVAWLAMLSPVALLAATNDFTADSNITVTGVTFGSTTADMIIFNGSTSESWSISGGTFTVSNPGSSFQVGSSDTSVKSITTSRSGEQVACAVNTTAGTSSLTLPVLGGTYTITPSSTTTCTGAGSGNTGGAIAPGGSGTSPAAAPTFQSYDPATGKVSTEAKAATPASTTAKPTTTAPAGSLESNLAKVVSEAATISQGGRAGLLIALGKIRDTASETAFDKSVVSKVVAGIKAVSAEVKDKILAFVTYGTETTDALGAGERGGVVNSFKEAFGKLPATDKDWEDVVKIGNGRWPSQTNKIKEDKAIASFRSIYKRAPDRAKPNDDAAVVVMAYGLRPRDRNLTSEAAAIKTYKAVFGRVPTTATAWDSVRAIAYSGAKR